MATHFGTTRPTPDARANRSWAVRLYDAGLVVLPCWGGGKAIPGTSFDRLADSPPSRAQVLTANYTGGLAILCGTEHPEGGYVLGIDIDYGPQTTWAAMPRGFLYLEAGTAPCRWHMFVRTVDRLQGQVDLMTGPKLVAELKGRGRVLRSWPTVPEGKQRGYRPLRLADTEDLKGDPPALTARQTAEGLADYLRCISHQDVGIREPVHRRHVDAAVTFLPEFPGDFLMRLGHALDRAGCQLRPGRDGWFNGHCPMHEDRRPSFAVNFERGCWVCFAGCGSGNLRTLALGLNVAGRAVFHKSWIIPRFEVTI